MKQLAKILAKGLQGILTGDMPRFPQNFSLRRPFLYLRGANEALSSVSPHAAHCSVRLSRHDLQEAYLFAMQADTDHHCPGGVHFLCPSQLDLESGLEPYEFSPKNLRIESMGLDKVYVAFEVDGKEGRYRAPLDLKLAFEQNKKLEMSL